MSVIPIKRSAVAILAGDIVELLRDEGPLCSAEVRRRLGVASGERFAAAVLLVKEEGAIERVRECTDATWRIPGDPRPVPVSMSTVANMAANRWSRL
ncbi:hypothetical protein [Nevskia ramosa]|uniref:hypothetical protein n=1 Tax=Nevskia ramosa TaxID=64002 RepID=UPI0023533FBE|nr:hypothetical protein [Nevskia ramosa]